MRYLLVRPGTNIIVGIAAAACTSVDSVYDLEAGPITGSPVPEDKRVMLGGTFAPARVYTAPV